MNRESRIPLKNTASDSSPSDEPQLPGRAFRLVVSVAAMFSAERGQGATAITGGWRFCLPAPCGTAEARETGNRVYLRVRGGRHLVSSVYHTGLFLRGRGQGNRILSR